MQKWAKNFPTTGLICVYFISRSFICWKYWENWAVSTKTEMDIAEKIRCFKIDTSHIRTATPALKFQ